MPVTGCLHRPLYLHIESLPNQYESWGRRIFLIYCLELLPQGKWRCLFQHTKVDVFGQMHSDGRSGYFVQRSIAIEVDLVVCRIASIWSQMMSTSCIISFHKAKFLSSNFGISTLVSYVEAIFYEKWEIFWPCLFLQSISFFLGLMLLLLPDSNRSDIKCGIWKLIL